MISISITLCAVAKYALGSSNCWGENNGLNSEWYLMLEAIDAESGANEPRPSARPTLKEKIAEKYPLTIH